MECVKRLLVADASQEFRCHLVESFQNEPDMEVVGETGDGLQLLELTQKLLPDVIVMEMVLSGLDGLEVLERLRGLSLERHPKILVLSSYVRGSIADLAAANGADHYMVQALPVQHDLCPHPPADHLRIPGTGQEPLPQSGGHGNLHHP